MTYSPMSSSPPPPMSRSYLQNAVCVICVYDLEFLNFERTVAAEAKAASDV